MTASCFGPLPIVRSLGHFRTLAILEVLLKMSMKLRIRARTLIFSRGRFFVSMYHDLSGSVMSTLVGYQSWQWVPSNFGEIPSGIQR